MDHESIVNRELENLILAHQHELEAMKLAFEKELRRAEHKLCEQGKRETSQQLELLRKEKALAEERHAE